MENSVIRTSSEVGQRVQLNREVKVRDDEPVKVRNEREAIPRDECQPGAKTIKPFLGSVIDRLVSSVSRANTTSAKPEKEETDEANRITALEAFMDANTDEGVREDADVPSPMLSTRERDTPPKAADALPHRYPGERIERLKDDGTIVDDWGKSIA
ncbi:hypothetical protein H2200_009413 [Cladophialophora chaetospira]|uniref:Uncharacterized protein n=1 Tax=Cladophialophora chaetospira TaxID=386627 RepID=A0AA38X420_9EURO|nr:hypothetical protein H2200_009413 [Cladophialophora chaetospira]